MDNVKTQDLLTQLKHLESSLSSFSFESLNSEEAATLRNSLRGFKGLLEDKIYNPKKPGKPDEIKEGKERQQSVLKPIAPETKFMAHISHEIRTPLNGIMGFANLLKEEHLTEGQEKKVNAILAASKNLMEIINEVLEYSKLSAGGDDFMEVDFNLHGLINDVVFLCQTLLVNPRIEMQLDIDDRIPTNLVGDPSKLSQVLLNLMGNAVKFVEEGYVRLEVNYIPKQHKDFHLEFVIKDSGIGMSQEQMNNIFEYFKQADEFIHTKYGGSGLGLCIVKELVEKLGGDISAKSSPGVGSTFTFNIPYRAGAKERTGREPHHRVEKPLKGKDALLGTGILVFEDNPMNQHLIREQLGKWGCKVYVTAQLDKGLAILKSQNIDLILMDLRMPDKDGFQISSIIRNDKRLKQVPIIALSADFTAKDGEDCVTAGINDFLLKPYTLDELLNKIIKHKIEDRPLSEETKALLRKSVISKAPKELLDVHGILEDCSGEIQVMEELVRLFKQNVYEFIGTTKICLKQEDLKGISFGAHKLKAGLRMLKMEGLANLMVDIQRSCEQNDNAAVKSHFQEFLSKYADYEAELDKAVVDIKRENNN